MTQGRQDLTAFVKAQATELGFDIVGVAAAGPFEETQARLLEHIEKQRIAGLAWFTSERAVFSCDPQNLLPQVRSIISLGISYLNSESPNFGELQGKVARYAWGRDYHDVLKEKMTALYDRIKEYLGEEAGEARFLVDTARIVDRAVAQRAGIGFFGRNTNIINKKYGSWIFLCEILTNLELDYDASAFGTCGKCTRCLDACPTNAIIEPGVVANDACISYLTIELRGAIPLEQRGKMGSWIFGCDVCQEVCPYNKKAQAGNHLEFSPITSDSAFPNLVDWLKLTASDNDFRQKFKNTPLSRPKRTGLRRNIAVALGNSNNEMAIAPLQEALQGETDPNVREHLEWAINKLSGMTQPNNT